MSATLQIDSYLAAQVMPVQDLKVDPQWHNISMTTPIGRFGYIHVDKPFAIPSRDPTQPSKPAFSATLLMAPGTNERPIVADLHRAAVMIAHAKLGPTIQRANPQTGQSENVPSESLFWVDGKQGGIHYPLRQGNDDYMKEPQKFEHRRGLWYINSGMPPKSKKNVDQAPVCLDEKGMPCSPELFYPGCYGRIGITAYWYENSGNRGVSFFLNWVQFSKHGEKLATFDRAGAAMAMAQKAGAISGDIGAPPAGFATGFGPNAAHGASPAGAGGAPYGFAAPAPLPGQPAAQPAGFAQPAATPGYPPTATPGGVPGGRPPGV
jgi:hypothetical protein